MTYDQARSAIPANAKSSATFGYPGEGGYSEYWRTPDGKVFEISNGPWDELEPFDWKVKS